MFKVAKREAEWRQVLPGVRIEFEPIGIKAVRAARRAAAERLGVDPEDLVDAGDALSAELLRRGIRAWEGVGDADGEPLPVSAETIELALADPDFFEAADRAYVFPYAAREREGNGSAPSPDGTGAGATPAKDTASSRAKRARGGGVKSAPTSSTSRKRTRAPKPGKS